MGSEGTVMSRGRQGHGPVAGKVRMASFLFALTIPVAAQALDRPISAQSLTITRTAGGARLTFVSRDPALLFPPIGSADDPATGSPGGIVVEVFPQTEPQQTVSAPGGLGNPGWEVRDGVVDGYLYRSSGPAVRKTVLRAGKLLKVLSDDAGLDLAAPLVGVAIRITTGSRRNCAVFPAGTVRRDQAGRFVARGAIAAALSDCSDASLLAPLALDCDSKSDYPTCGGPCPSGEECVAIYGPPGGCACTPIGVTPCGAQGWNSAACESGACPAGETCQYYRYDVGSYACGCFDPNQPCGAGGGPGVCPPDAGECQPLEYGGYTCTPTFCGGTYPTCGGPCGAGRACVPVTLEGMSSGLCVCGAPENQCDQMCGGFTCAPGEVCTGHDSGACSCEPL
jgi:hypothetical protein